MIDEKYFLETLKENIKVKQGLIEALLIDNVELAGHLGDLVDALNGDSKPDMSRINYLISQYKRD